MMLTKDCKRHLHISTINNHHIWACVTPLMPSRKVANTL